MRAREIYEEGIQIPPMKLFRAGVPSEDLFTLLAENVRNAPQVLHALNEVFLAAGRLGEFDGYRPLVVEIVKFFKTGQPPVAAEETLEILAFMEAADESKRQCGSPVSMASVLEKAKKEAAAKLSGL